MTIPITFYLKKDEEYGVWRAWSGLTSTAGVGNTQEEAIKDHVTRFERLNQCSLFNKSLGSISEGIAKQYTLTLKEAK